MDLVKTEKYARLLLTEGLGLDLSDPNLIGTPRRIAKMYCNEFFANIDKEFEGYSLFPNKDEYNQIILLDNIFFTSICSHHFLPFTGLAWVAYIPKDFLIGASKPARLVEHYAKRPQLQERLQHQIISSFVKVVKPLGTLVYIRATHQCMKCRGVRQHNNSAMQTSSVHGVFEKDYKAKEEVYNMIKLSKV